MQWGGSLPTSAADLQLNPQQNRQKLNPGSSGVAAHLVPLRGLLGTWLLQLNRLPNGEHLSTSAWASSQR